jgi:hypothetical protein
VRKVPRRASLQYASTEGIQAEQSTPLALVYKGAFLVGERVYVIKDGSQAGKVALPLKPPMLIVTGEGLCSILTHLGCP